MFVSYKCFLYTVHVEDEGRSIITTLFLFIVSVVVLVVVVVVILFLYNHYKENRRKRFYWANWRASDRKEMGREIQHECDWHFCNGPFLVLTSAPYRKDLKANTELKSHTWPLQVKSNHLNHDYDFKKLFKSIWMGVHLFLKVSSDFCVRLLYFCTSYTDLGLHLSARGSTENYVWQHVQRHNSLTNCCILRLSTVIPKAL